MSNTRQEKPPKMIEIPSEATKDPDIFNWWIYSEFKLDGARSNPYTYPVCKKAEHNFLIYLMTLDEIYENKEEIPIVDVTAHSYHREREIKARAIYKKAIFLEKDWKKGYYFGTDTYLMLDTHLAGSIGRSFIGVPSNDGTTAIQIARPLNYNPSWIKEKINTEIGYFKLSEKITRDPFLCPHPLESLNLALELIKNEEEKEGNRGYIHALIRMLEKLQIPANTEAMIRNSQYLQI